MLAKECSSPTRAGRERIATASARSPLEPVGVAALESEADLNRFADAYTSVGPAAVTLAQLRGRRVFAARAEDGRMLGGYVLLTEPPFRTFSSVSGGPAPSQLSIPIGDVAEVGALWRDDGARRAVMASLYRSLASECEATGKRHVLCSTVDPRFHERMALAGDDTQVWSGVVECGHGPARMWVHFGPMARFVAWATEMASRAEARSAPAEERTA